MDPQSTNADTPPHTQTHTQACGGDGGDAGGGGHHHHHHSHHHTPVFAFEFVEVCPRYVAKTQKTKIPQKPKFLKSPLSVGCVTNSDFSPLWQNNQKSALEMAWGPGYEKFNISLYETHTL